MMKKILLILVFIALSSLMFGVHISVAENNHINPDFSRLKNIKEENKGQFFLDKTVESLKHDSLIDAFTYINQAIEAEPKNPNILYMKAILDFRTEDFQSAIKYFNDAIKYSKEENYEYYKSRSLCYLLLNNYKNALKDLNVIEKMYNEKMPEVDYSSIYILMGLIEAKEMNENIELPIKKELSSNELVNISYSNDFKLDNIDKKSYKIIYKYIVRGIKQHPNNAALYTMKAICDIKTGLKSDIAIEDLNHAIEINPYYYPAYLEMADIYADMGEYHPALNNYLKVFNISPQNYYILWKIGDSYLGLQEYNKARMYYNMSLDNSNNIKYTKDDMEMYMASIKKMVDVQTRENDFRAIIASLNKIIRAFNNKQISN